MASISSGALSLLAISIVSHICNLFPNLCAPSALELSNLWRRHRRPGPRFFASRLFICIRIGRARSVGTRFRRGPAGVFINSSRSRSERLRWHCGNFHAYGHVHRSRIGRIRMRARLGPQPAFINALYMIGGSRKYKMVVGVRFHASLRTLRIHILIVTELF